MKRRYIFKNFRADTLAIIALVNQIVETYIRDGLDLTLRQLYYVFIAEDLFPDTWIDATYNRRNGLAPNTKNTLKNYKRLVATVADARLAGLVDWDAITDRTRNLTSWRSETSPGAAIRHAALYYRLNPWTEQEYRPEVWVEKEALAGVAESAVSPLHVPYMACRGNMSLSEIHEAGMRLKRYAENGQQPVVIYLGDHDPSGIDMSRDVLDRLSLFMGGQAHKLSVDRIALNFDQVQQYNPPANPAKPTDSRYKAYAAQYGEESWELDALKPAVLRDLIRASVESYMDRGMFEATRARQEEERKLLTAAGEHWNDVAAHLMSGGHVEDVDWEEDEDEGDDWSDDEDDTDGEDD